MKFGQLSNLAIFIATVGFCFSSCKKMDDSYKEYIKDGEIIYASKADSVVTIPGRNRLLITWFASIDPKVTKAKIFWNNGANVKEYDIVWNPAKTIEQIIIDGLQEGSYTFDLITYDAENRASVKVSFTGNVYGESYLSSLNTRKIDSAEVIDNIAHIGWNKPSFEEIGTEITYIKDNGETAIIYTTAEDSTILSDYKAQTEIKYRSMFLPEGNAIDTFYSVESIITPLSLLDKSKFARWNTADFPYTEYNIGTGSNIEKLWDNVYTGYGYIYLETLPLPRSFTFDLGQLASIKRIRLSPNWDSQLYQNGNIKTAEIWGSPTDDVSSDFSKWTYIGKLNSFKPSGLPLGQTTTADLVYAQHGEYFDVAEDTPPVRYIRFVVQDTWAGTISMHITELTFWGNY